MTEANQCGVQTNPSKSDQQMPEANIYVSIGTP